LTRAIGTMTANTFIALVGVGIAAAVANPATALRPLQPLRRARARIA
jgi:hypothetical protein